MVIKGGIGGGTDGVVGMGTNDLPHVLTWLIHELRLCTKDCSTTGLTSLSSL